MGLPVTGLASLFLAVIFGAAFGMLLERGGVTLYNVILNQFRLRDFTVIKVMLTAIVVGSIGVWSLSALNLAPLEIKPVHLGIAVGGAIFGIGMAIYGYCPGTGIAAAATGRMDALVGIVGMLTGSILYALSYSWLDQTLLSIWAFGKIRIPYITGLPDILLILLLAITALIFFRIVKKRFTKSSVAYALVIPFLIPALSETSEMESPRDLQIVVHNNVESKDVQLHMLRNVKNILGQGVHEVEVVSHGSGITLVVQKQSAAPEEVKDLIAQGVRFAACENTMREKGIEKGDLINGVATVPSGAVEIALKQKEGFSYFKP